MHSSSLWDKGQVFGNDGVFNLGTIIFLQQVEHGKALVLYTQMPFEENLRNPPESHREKKQRSPSRDEIGKGIEDQPAC